MRQMFTMSMAMSQTMRMTKVSLYVMQMGDRMLVVDTVEKCWTFKGCYQSNDLAILEKMMRSGGMLAWYIGKTA